MKHRAFLLTILIIAGFSSFTAKGDLLYGIINGSDLVQINTNSLSGSVIGDIGFTSVGGLTMGSGGQLYGISTSIDSIITADPGSLPGTLVGPTGRDSTFSTGLAYDAPADVLYGTTTQGSGFSSYLVSYSTSTGSASSIGETGTGTIVGLSMDSSGQLWGIDGGGSAEHLVRINKTTGATNVVGLNGLMNLPSIGGFAIGLSGTFWAVDAGSSQYRLLSINPVSGAPTIIGNINGLNNSGSIMTGLTAVPEPATMILLGLGGLVLRKSKRHGV